MVHELSLMVSELTLLCCYICYYRELRGTPHCFYTSRSVYLYNGVSAFEGVRSFKALFWLGFQDYTFFVKESLGELKDMGVYQTWEIWQRNTIKWHFWQKCRMKCFFGVWLILQTKYQVISAASIFTFLSRKLHNFYKCDVLSCSNIPLSVKLAGVII